MVKKFRGAGSNGGEWAGTVDAALSHSKVQGSGVSHVPTGSLSVPSLSLGAIRTRRAVRRLGLSVSAASAGLVGLPRLWSGVTNKESVCFCKFHFHCLPPATPPTDTVSRRSRTACGPGA